MARNLKPNEVIGSLLFKSVAPRIDSISQSQLLYEICVASTKTEVYLERDNVSASFVWVQTPQGNEFWQLLSREYNWNKHG